MPIATLPAEEIVVSVIMTRLYSSRGEYQVVSYPAIHPCSRRKEMKLLIHTSYERLESNGRAKVPLVRSGSSLHLHLPAHYKLSCASNM